MSFIVALVVCAITAGLAARKGYNPALWFLAGGILGLIILAFLPFADAPGDSEDVQRDKKKTGDIVGGVISGVVALIVAVMWLA